MDKEGWVIYGLFCEFFMVFFEVSWRRRLGFFLEEIIWEMEVLEFFRCVMFSIRYVVGVSK